MLLHEIITTNATGTQAIRTDLLLPYKKSLLTYFRRYYNSEPLLIVTDVFNIGGYGIIAPESEASEAVQVYLDSAEIDDDDRESAEEVIWANSLALKDL